MEIDFLECSKLIGTKLKGKIIEKNRDDGVKNFKQYILHPDSIKFLRNSFFKKSIVIILPHTSHTNIYLENKIYITINDKFIITQISM